MMKAFGHDPRPILRKSAEQLQVMRTAGRMLRQVIDAVGEKVVPGVLDSDLDRLAREMIERMGAKPSFLGYRGFPATICASINQEIVHGIPRGRRLEEGDIIGVDIGLQHKEFHADSAWTFAVGEVSTEAKALMAATEASLWEGIRQMREGNRLGDVSAAIQARAEQGGYGVVRDFTGHGIGRSLHEAPELPNFGYAGKGKRLQTGVVIAIEPMVNEGSPDTRVESDNWTVVTADGTLSAHFEHSVAVTEDGPLVLTQE